MHVAVIPARMGSEGFRFKNRRFFQHTASFLSSLTWMDRIVVSTDDPVVAQAAGERSYEVHDRPPELAGPAVSIKAVMESVVHQMDIALDDLLWLFYLPVLYKNAADFEHGKAIMESTRSGSLCTFVPASTHPYNCWKYDAARERLEQYVPNDAFRRQDLPPAWKHYHYVCCLRASELPQLNSELLSPTTYPVFLDESTARQLIEVDTPEDYERWKALQRG
jgi:CMP-N-acetylneuraminic acid synthetase